MLGELADGYGVVRQCAGEREQLVGLGAGGDADRLDVAGEQAALQREIVGDDAPFDPGLDLDRVLGLDGRDRRRERQVLRRVVAWIGAQQGDEVAEALDEGGLGVHGSLSRGVDLKLHGPWTPPQAGRAS